MNKYLVDPQNITNLDASDFELELLMLFWICAAGKKAETSARSLNNLLSHGSSLFNKEMPFEIIKYFSNDLPLFLKKFGIGCYNNKANCMWQLVNSNIDLRKCDILELESIKGIGPKTSRCFLLHSRKNARYAGLDTHVLKYMRDQGLSVPKSTPSGKKYLELEKIFLKMAEESSMTIAEFDLQIWKKYSNKL